MRSGVTWQISDSKLMPHSIYDVLTQSSNYFWWSLCRVQHRHSVLKLGLLHMRHILGITDASMSRWTRPALQLWSLGKTISGWNRVCPWANWTWEQTKCSIDREGTRLLTSPRFPEIRSEYCVLCRAMWLHDSVVASVEVSWGALANARII